MIKNTIKKILKKWYLYQALKNKPTLKGTIKVNGKTRLSSTTNLGNNANFNGLEISGRGKVKIGDNFHSGKDCLFITETHQYEGNAIPYDHTSIIKDIHIEDNVWLGSRVIILGGVTIGEGAIIQAGSCVCSNIPKYSIAGGHPAKVFKKRNIEHYNQCKLEGKFH